jgi:hypothetical protein
MSEPRAGTKCHRTVDAVVCGEPWSAHGRDGACPRGTGTFRGNTVQCRRRASSSFTLAEIEAIEFALTGLRGGRDLRVFARTSGPALAAVARKMASMRASIELREAWGPTAHGRAQAAAEAVTGVRARARVGEGEGEAAE